MHKKLLILNESEIKINNNSFEAVIIHPQLLPFVKSIEIEKDIEYKSHIPSFYKVLPGLCVVMGMQYQGSLFLLENNQKKRLSQCGISGLQNHYKLFQTDNAQTRSILIRFYPWAINSLFNEDASHVANHALCLSELIKRSLIEQLADQITTAKTTADLANIVQTFLIQLLTHKAKIKGKSSIIISLCNNLLNDNRFSTIHEIAKYYGLSVRTLERQFKTIIGLSPKQFLRLCQFRKTLVQLYAGVHWEQIIECHDYYDQAHLINSFKQFSGVTPSQLINSDYIAF